ncbi:MAG: ABC transporter permease [Thermoanaerobaculia bacterium]|nr:ABC transporter permease [Thermoanaerobaculia bacterium]
MLRLGLVSHLFRRTARTQGKRMAMTVAAIAWGTLAIVLLLSFGEGLKRNFSRGSRGMGEGIVVVWPGSTSKSFAGFPQGRSLRFRPEDLDLVRASVAELESASAEMIRWGNNVSRGRRTLSKTIKGVEPTYGDLRNQIPQAGGRFLNEIDEREKRRVAFLGNRTKDELFGSADAVGETLLVNQVPFTVIGVMTRKIQMGNYSGMDQDHVLIPLSTFRTLYGRRYVSDLVVRARTPELTPVLKWRLYEVLGARYRFDPEDRRTLQIWDTVETQRVTRNMALGIEIFLGLIGALTLLIGGIGVANIMYAVVRHRTREIGVQMALGARRSYVLGPLVVESLAITALGGAIGIGAGVALVSALAWAQTQTSSEALELLGAPTFSFGVAVTVVVLLGAIGFLAGYFPSRRAVAIQPAAALRYE